MSKEPQGCSISCWLWFVLPLPPSLCAEQTCAFPLPSRQLERAWHATSLALRQHPAELTFLIRSKIALRFSTVLPPQRSLCQHV